MANAFVLWLWHLGRLWAFESYLGLLQTDDYSYWISKSLLKYVLRWFVFSHFFVRAKYHKLKYGTELNQGDMKPPSYDSGKLILKEVQVIKKKLISSICSYNIYNCKLISSYLHVSYFFWPTYLLTLIM